MLAALAQSPEASHLVSKAKKYVKGVKGTLVQKKKALEAKRKADEATASGGAAQQ